MIKKVIVGFLFVILLFSFVCAIYGGRMINGHFTQEKRFSVLAYIENISDHFEALPSVEDLTAYWLLDYYTVVENLGGGAVHIYTVYFEEYDGDSDILEFFDSIRGFFRRLYQTFKWIGKWIVGIFTTLPLLLPWNENAMEVIPS